MLIHNPTGDYSFLPGGYPYSSGVVAEDGFEVVHVTLRRAVPWRQGFERIDSHLREAGRGRAALCAVELRSPEPYTRAGFMEFNRGYRTVLEEWELLVDGENPVARTNVSPQWAAPSEPSLYGFSYTVPAAGEAPRTFIVAGAGELRGGPLEDAQVVRPGERTPDAGREKAAYVMRAMSKRLEGLGVSWEDVTATEVYSVLPLDEVLGPAVLDTLGAAALHGLRWYHAHPPIDELEYEMDARGVRKELYL